MLFLKVLRTEQMYYQDLYIALRECQGINTLFPDKIRKKLYVPLERIIMVCKSK